MKAKTFILTFLMMMSSPFLFGQHWTDPGELYQPGTMQFTSKIYLDNELQTNTSYEIAVFNGTTLLEVANIVAIGSGENTLYHVDLNVQGTDGMGDIYFKLYNGEKEFVSVEKIQFQDHGSGGTHINPSEIHFKTVAQIEGTEFDVVYPSLQKAIDACKEGDNTIELLADNAEDVTIKQVEGVNVTIDGGTSRFDYSGTITIHGNARYQGEETLTFKNIDFTTNEAGHYFIDSNSTGSVERYAHNVTVLDCNFTATDAGVNSAAAMRIRQGFDIAIYGGTFTNLHSALQAYGNAGITVSGITLNGKNGISAGTSTGVVIKNSNITATGYGVRADGSGAYEMTLTDNTISAELPVVVRNAEEVAYKLTIAGDNNNFTAKKEGNNPEGYQVVFTTGDDGTYLAPTTGQFVLSVPENFNVYPVYVAQVGNLKYTSVDAALTAAQPGDVVQIFAGTYTCNNQNQTFDINKAITVEGERNDQGENLVNITGKLNITADGATAKNLNVNNGGSTAGYISAKDVLVEGCNVTGGNGFRYCYTAGTVTFKDSKITGATYGIHFDGSAGGNIVIDNCVITGWTSFASTITKVTMKDTSFEEGNYNYVRFYQNEVFIDDCIFNENMAIDIAVNGNTTTINNCTFENGNIEDLFEDKDIVNSTIIVDGTTLKREASIGNTYYETLAEALEAAQNDDEVKILVAGTYALTTSGKNITITGAVDGVVFDNIGKKNMGGANVTFNNVTFDYYPNVTYTGLQHSGNLVYNDCTFEGQPFLYGTSETFNGCTFNQNSADAYNVWTYGAAQVAFNECTFNSAGKSVLIYAEGANIFNDVTVTGCTFNASEAVDGKAAIEMDSSLTAGINLTIDGETTATGFGSGNVSNNSLWNNKKGNQGVNNDITVTVDGVVVLAPTTVAKIGETEYNTLQEAITAAGTTTTQIEVVGSTTENINIAEGANITLAFAQDVTLNGYFAPFEGNLTINGGTINNTNSGASAIEINAGELNLNNVNIASARHAVRIDGAVTATIDGGVYKSGIGTGTGTYHAVNVSDAANVTIKDGTFVGPKGTTADSGAAINVKAGSNVTIVGGNYSGGKNNTLASAGTLVVTGGTFDQNPSAYVTTPYVVIKKSDNEYNVIKGVAKIGETYYESLAAAVNAAQSGNTIVLLADITEDVTVNNAVTINGKPEENATANSTYTGKMTVKADLTIKNVNFDGNGYNGYAVETRGANYLTVEDCTAKNYGFGFIQLASGTALTTVKNVTVSNMNCGVKVDYSNAVVLENLNLDCAVAAVLNSNYGEKTITIKDSELSILGTWKRNETIKTTYVFEGSNTVDQFIIEEELDNFKLAIGATLTAVEGLNISATEEGYVVEYNEGVYSVVAGNILNQTTDKKYAKLQVAIDEASANDVIVLLKDITENVTITKDLTIDGKAEGATANSKYTGKMTVNASLNINIRNIDFVKGYIDELGGEHGYFTIVDCNFDGVDKSIGYAVTVRGGDKLTIENSTAMNYNTGMLYMPSAVANIDIKDVEVSNVAAAFNITYSGDGTFENVKVDNVTYGIHFQIYGSRTYTVKNCNLKGATNPFWFWDKSNNTAKVTVVFEGNNDLGTKGITVNAGELQLATDATLTAAEGLNIKATEEGYVVEYNEGVYSVVAGNIALERNGEIVKKFATIQDAIDAAVDNDVIVVLEDVKLSDEDVVYPIENNSDVKVMLSVKGKDITLDLNEKTIEVDYEGGLYLYAVVFVEDGANLTVTGNGKIDVLHDENRYVQQNNVTRYNVAYMFWKRGNTGSLVIKNGTFHAYDLEDSIIYTNGDEIVTVEGGNFSIDMVDDQSPWIFNGQGQNAKKVIVKGGTFNADINHQFWANEVYVPETLALQYNGDEEGTWTVVESVAYVEEIATSTGSTVREVGYATIEDAIEAIGIRNTNETVTMLEDVVLENTITIAAGKEVILDLNGKTISGVCNSGQGHMFMVQNTADLTVKDSSENKEGKITYARGTSNTGWVIDLEGDLILESGTIELTGDSWSIGYAVDVRPNSWGSEYTEATTFTMKGGKLVSSDAAVRVASSSADDHENVSANFIMNGGEIEAAWDGIFVQQSNAAYDILNVRINGGNIKSELSPLRLYGPVATSVLNNVENPITLNITGGTFDYIGNDLGNEKWLVRGVIMVSGGATFEQMLGYTDFEITGGTFDGDVNAYCAEGFAAVNNGDGTWEVMPAQEQYLGAGYNWYSSYLNINTDNLLEALGESGISVAGNNWIAVYSSGWDYDDHTLDFSKMYMIETNQEHTLKLAGELLNAGEIDIEIEQGWNWIGYPSNERVEINTALTNHNATDGDRIVTQGGFVEYASMYGGWIGSAVFTHFEPTKGYQYFANNDAEFNYNIVPAQTRGNNETAVATHYSVDYTKYPFNMTMVAVVDGAMNDNYEVAALVNGEVRGSARPVYVEALDAYMLFLTISGDEVEEVSFKYYDITTEEEYELVNRIEYSNNAMVGSVNEPYVLSRGTTGIGEAAMSNINIYPNPTTTGTEINLQATCDKVEVYNALGVKVIEYHNVDAIDALETAGIYVIRITNDGNVQNCRLVVK